MAKRNRPQDVCSGCHRRMPIVNVTKNWCDACRKAVDRYLQKNPEGQATQFLESRWLALRQRTVTPYAMVTDGHRSKLLAAWNNLVQVMLAVNMSSSDQREVKRIFQPYLEAIADQVRVEPVEPEQMLELQGPLGFDGPERAEAEQTTEPVVPESPKPQPLRGDDAPAVMVERCVALLGEQHRDLIERAIAKNEDGARQQVIARVEKRRAKAAKEVADVELQLDQFTGTGWFLVNAVARMHQRLGRSRRSGSEEEQVEGLAVKSNSIEQRREEFFRC